MNFKLAGPLFTLFGGDAILRKQNVFENVKLFDVQMKLIKRSFVFFLLDC